MITLNYKVKDTHTPSDKTKTNTKRTTLQIGNTQNKKTT